MSCLSYYLFPFMHTQTLETGPTHGSGEGGCPPSMHSSFMSGAWEKVQSGSRSRPHSSPESDPPGQVGIRSPHRDPRGDLRSARDPLGASPETEPPPVATASLDLRLERGAEWPPRGQAEEGRGQWRARGGCRRMGRGWGGVGVGAEGSGWGQRAGAESWRRRRHLLAGVPD